jgi:hypothetical protein
VSRKDLQRAAEAVIRRAAEAGSLLPRQVRETVAEAGVDPALYKEVLALTSSQLLHRKGRYYYVSDSSRQRHTAEQRSQAIHRAVHDLVETYRKLARLQERRETDRITFIQQVVVEAEDGQVYRMLTEDISASGIRLLGNRGLLGQRLHVRIPAGNGEEIVFAVRILWTCMVGDDLYENGGVFLELVRDATRKPASEQQS